MSLASQVSALATRMGQECKSIRADLTGGGGALTARVTAATSSTSAGYAAAGGTGLTVTVEAGKAYKIRATGQWSTAATTTGMGIRLGGTATATRVRYNATVYGGAFANMVQNSESALSTAVLKSPGATAANKDYGWIIDGLIVVLAAGTIEVQFASEIAGSAVTIQPDCYLELQEIA